MTWKEVFKKCVQKYESNETPNMEPYEGRYYLIELGYLDREPQLRTLKRVIEEILKRDPNMFVLRIPGYNINGLDETNRLLIENGFVIYDNYFPERQLFVPKGDWERTHRI